MVVVVVVDLVVLRQLKFNDLDRNEAFCLNGMNNIFIFCIFVKVSSVGCLLF